MDDEALIVGIDDVTRAPVIGSLICVAYGIKKKYIRKLGRLGVKDSKLLTRMQRDTIAVALHSIGKYAVCYIDALAISTGENLNDLECRAYCELMKQFPNAKEYYINNFDRTRKKFIERAERLGYRFNWKKVHLGHENETRIKVIGAASIIAKHLSDLEYERLKKEVGFDFGSGNPNDPKTVEFLKLHVPHNMNLFCPGCRIIRWSWATIKRVKKMLEVE